MPLRDWRNLEQRVAQYFERSGYTARTNQKLLGRSGLVHEIDVLAEKHDAAVTHRVAIECKAWKSRIEKDVIYKLEQELRDLGLSKGIVVSIGGLTTGASVAAHQAHIDVWGPDEIRHYLGDVALAGLPIAVPDEALGLAVTISREAAEREIRKARSGFAGIGGEDVTSIDLVWIPAIEFQLAITRTRPGLIKAREEVIRRWNLYETLTGRRIGQRDEPRPFTPTALDGAVARSQTSSPQIISAMKKALTKHRDAKTDAAVAKRQAAYNDVGLPGSTREFVVEGEKAVFVPYFVGRLGRKGTERFVAIHAVVGDRDELLEPALHERVDVVHAAMDASATHAGPMTEADRAAPGAEPTPPVPSPDAPTCRCGAQMVLRNRKADGAAFWGCPTFPKCRHTLAID